MDLDATAVAYAVRIEEGLKELRRHGVSEDHIDPDWQPIWRFIDACVRKHGHPPSAGLLEQRFDWVELPDISPRDLKPLTEDLERRHRYQEVLRGMEDVAQQMVTFDDVDAGVDELKRIAERYTGVDRNGHVKDAFEKSSVENLIKDVERRRKQKRVMTGLPSLDRVTGGLHPGRLVVVGGRPGVGKSMVTVWILAHAIRSEHKVLFYSLEMTQEEVFARLYTILSRLQNGAEGTLKNMDFHTGKIKRQILLGAAKNFAKDYRGRFLLSDFSCPATLEQIEADVETHQPDVVWVDYLTLMPKPKSKNREIWATVQELTSGLKRIALRHNVVMGVCAQLNRLASGKASIGTEHIAMSDSIGQDADIVVALAKGPEKLKYQVVKNRCGPELNPILLKFAPNEGWIQEILDD